MPTRSGPMVQLCERHAALHASHLQAALAQCAEKTGAVEAWEEWRRATEAGWEDLAAAQFEAVGRTSSLRVSKMPSKGELVGYSLEELAGADEAVGGVPLVAHLLMERISAGQVGVAQDAAEGGAGGAQRMVAADGIFRISGEADEVHALGDALHAADAAAALAVARQTDPYVLAACLKQFYRRLARPLFPESKYQALLQARRSAARPPDLQTRCCSAASHACAPYRVSSARSSRAAAASCTPRAAPSWPSCSSWCTTCPTPTTATCAGCCSSSARSPPTRRATAPQLVVTAPGPLRGRRPIRPPGGSQKLRARRRAPERALGGLYA